ncbi:MAG: PEP-CTERM sorting domain-containing protein [Burkholderiales bacterium]|nr:PEP-CTERM sorting domain-containing protein [Burkholderiales bacterium]
MKRTSIMAALLIAAGSSHAQLQPGEIAFTAFNADEDGFAIVALSAIAPFSALYFTDNEWSGGAAGSGGFNSGEGTYAWVTGAAGIAAGTVVRFSDIDGAARAASVGTFGQVLSGLPGFAATGDSVFAYSGASAAQPAVMLAAVSTDGFAGSTLAGSGLEVGVNAVSVQAGADFAEYGGARSGLATFGAYATRIADAGHWISQPSGDFAALTPDLTPFTVAAVPEPETYALLATGLGLIGLRIQQRRRREADKRVAIASGALAR